MFTLIAVSYPERRLEFFKEQLAAARRRLEWSTQHNPDENDHAEKGEVVSFYEWAVNIAERSMKPSKKRTRPVVRVDVKTGEVVLFSSVKEARDSIGGNTISMELMTHRPLKGYRFYYEEDWKGDGK